MTRIVAGKARGRNLKVPRSGTRPTSERVREAVFSRLEHMGYVDDTTVLDLYSGSGALGLEAMSRGATYVECVESYRPAAKLIAENAQAMNLEVQVSPLKVETWVSQHPQRAFDVVFLDPPYSEAEEKIATVLAGLVPHLSADAIVLVERSKRSAQPQWPTELQFLDDRTWGDTRIWTARHCPRQDRV